MTSASGFSEKSENIPIVVSPREKRAWFAIAALLIVSYALFLCATWFPVIVGPDDHGYYAQGLLLASKGRMWFNLDSPVQFVGGHWLRDNSARYVSRYSPGMGILVASVSWLASPEASVAINPVLAIVSLVGIWALVGTRLGPGWGAAAVAAMMLSPTFTGQAMLGGSHMAVTSLVVWGTHLLLRWRERGGALRAFAAGVLMGFIPVVRPPEVMLALGVGMLLLLSAVDGTRPWRHLLLAIGGAFVAVIPLLLYNQETFGHFSRTAYAITKAQSAFHLSYVRTNLAFYSSHMLRDGLGVFAVLAIPGMVYVAAARETRVRGAFLALLTVPVLTLYLLFFFVPREQPDLAARYLLPVFPLMIFAVLSLVRRVSNGLPRIPRWSLVGVLFAVHAAWGLTGIESMTRRLLERKKPLATETQAVKELVPPGSVVFSPNKALLINLDILQRWRVADRLLSLDDPRNAILDGEVDSLSRQRGKRRLQTARFEGLSVHQRDSLFAELARRWGGGSAVYYVGPALALDRPTSPLLSRESFTVLAERKLPPLPADAAKSAEPGAHRETFVIARWKAAGTE